MSDQKKTLIIYDTDMDTDCDDAGALAIIYEYVKREKAVLLGVIADSVSPYAAACCEYLGKYYGIEVPVGAVSSRLCAGEERFAGYRRHMDQMNKTQGYNRLFADMMQKEDTDYPDAVSVYRRILAEAEDNSVTVVCVGVLTAVAAAVLSGADEISPLTGAELFAKKVCRVVSMGDPDLVGLGFNWGMDKVGAIDFFEHCPVSVYASQSGTEVVTGASLSDKFPEEHPVRRIYEIYNGPHTGRCSWDLIAALYALEPDSPLFTVEEKGTCRCDMEKSYWDEQGSRRDYQIFVKVPAEEMAEYLERRMTGDF